MVYIIQVCSQLASWLLASCQQRCMTYHCCVYSNKTPDDGQRNCPKHVEFYSKNKFEKLVHLVGFIIRFYEDARSPEHQIPYNILAVASPYTEVTTNRNPNCVCEIPDLQNK